MIFTVSVRYVGRLCSKSQAVVCLTESYWRTTHSSMCLMWLMSWAAHMSSLQHWYLVSLWTRPLTSLRSSGMRYKCCELCTAYSTIYTCLLPNMPHSLESEHNRTPESCQYVCQQSWLELIVSVHNGFSKYQHAFCFSSFVASVRFVSKSWSCAWERFLSSDTCRLIRTGPTSTLIHKLTRSVCLR